MSKPEMTAAQELRDWLNNKLYEQDVMAEALHGEWSSVDKAVFQVLLRLVDDVEKLKERAMDIYPVEITLKDYPEYRLIREIRDHTYGGEEIPNLMGENDDKRTV